MICLKHMILWYGTLLLALSAGLGVCRAEDPVRFDPAPRAGVLLLNNGETIQGRITRAGDYFIVVVTNGEIRIKAASVEFVCDDLKEGYSRKRSAIRLDTAQEHLQLGQWCLHHGLIDEARRELAEAESKQPAHPLIAVLRRRLEVDRRPPQRAKPPASPAKAVSAEELDRLVRTMPPGSVETFAQSIQPILVNHCTTSGCHNPQSDSGFRLRKVPASRPPGRRLTQRNLHATLEWVDREHPEASPLLTAPLRAHGTTKGPIFSPKELAQYQQVGRWVFGLAQGAAKKHPSQVEPQSGHLSQAIAPKTVVDKGPFAAPRAVQAAAQQPVADSTKGTDATPNVPGQRPSGESRQGRYELPRRSPPMRGNPEPGFKPVDPFDPAIFNRRYHSSE